MKQALAQTLGISRCPICPPLPPSSRTGPQMYHTVLHNLHGNPTPTGEGGRSRAGRGKKLRLWGNPIKQGRAWDSTYDVAVGQAGPKARGWDTWCLRDAFPIIYFPGLVLILQPLLGHCSANPHWPKNGGADGGLERATQGTQRCDLGPPPLERRSTYLSGTLLIMPTFWVFGGRCHCCLICAH